MRKRILQKAVALLVFTAFLGVSASGLWAAPQRTAPVTISTILKAPAQFLANLLPFFRNLFRFNPPAPAQQPQTTNGPKMIKTTGTIKSIRLSDGD